MLEYWVFNLKNRWVNEMNWGHRMLLYFYMCFRKVILAFSGHFTISSIFENWDIVIYYLFISKTFLTAIFYHLQCIWGKIYLMAKHHKKLWKTFPSLKEQTIKNVKNEVYWKQALYLPHYSSSQKELHPVTIIIYNIKIPPEMEVAPRYTLFTLFQL